MIQTNSLGGQNRNRRVVVVFSNAAPLWEQWNGWPRLAGVVAGVIGARMARYGIVSRGEVAGGTTWRCELLTVILSGVEFLVGSSSSSCLCLRATIPPASARDVTVCVCTLCYFCANNCLCSPGLAAESKQTPTSTEGLRVPPPTLPTPSVPEFSCPEEFGCSEEFLAEEFFVSAPK
jgi:hypothetical protein